MATERPGMERDWAWRVQPRRRASRCAHRCVARSTAIDTPAAPTLAPTAAPTATPDPWADLTQYTMDGLRARSYGAGQIEIMRTMEQLPNFTRYLIAYPSDGLRITGMLQIQSNKAFDTSGDWSRSE